MKLQVFRPVSLVKRNSNTDAFLCIMPFFQTMYFDKYLRTAASDYSFTIVIYLFSVVSSQLNMIFYSEENVH